MALSLEMQVAQHRLVLFSLGGIAALALWALGENWDNAAIPPPLYLALFTFMATYSGVALALAGPVSVVRALRGALLTALPITALVSLAGLGQVVATDLLDEPVMLSVIVVLVLMSTPFLLVWLETPNQWRSYAALFDAAWTMTVRYGVAYIFVAVFWLVLFLSNALLELVGVDIIDWLLETDWAPFALSGAVLGLGLAVVYELRNKISPFLVLRLLRLLVPVVLLVQLVFLGALPFRGLSDLFGAFSAAATLMGTAIVAITLISTALDRDDTQAVHTIGIRIATRLLAMLLPLLALLAVWAVILRVREYGWTPDRVLAGASAAFVLAYSLGYAGSVLRGKGWAARVRDVNVVMALAVIGVSALWLTPVLNTYRISTNSQIARFEAGKASVEQLPLWDFQNSWGKPGRAALAHLESLSERADHAELLTRITAVRSEPSKYKFTQALETQQAVGKVEHLIRMMVILPDGASLPDNAFGDLPSYRLSHWLKGCELALPDGRPGCVMIQGAFSVEASGAQQAMVLYLDEHGKTRANHVWWPENGEIEVNDVYDSISNSWANLPGGVISRVLDGAYDIRPSGTNALFVDGAILAPGN